MYFCAEFLINVDPLLSNSNTAEQLLYHIQNYKEMYLTTEKKQEIFEKHGQVATNTGSTEGQIALFSFRINHLTEHLKQNKKDFGTQRALIGLVGKRRSLLDYLKRKDIERYRAIIKELNLRK